MAGKAVNNGATPKRKAGGKPFEKGDKRINRAGAPKRGESWAEVWKRISNMTGPEVAEYGLSFAKTLRELPSTVTLKEIAVIRSFISIINDPTPGLLNAAMDRVEGTPRQTLEIDDKRIDDELAAALEELVAARQAKANRAHQDADGEGAAGDAPAVESAP